MIKEEDIKIGDRVQFEEYWTQRSLCGYVNRFSTGQRVQVTLDTNSIAYVKLESLYRSKNDCIKGIQEKNDKIVAEYKAEITDLESLIAFPLKHNVGQCEEYTDYEAIRAYTERAAELVLPIVTKSEQNEIERDQLEGKKYGYLYFFFNNRGYFFDKYCDCDIFFK